MVNKRKLFCLVNKKSFWVGSTLIATILCNLFFVLFFYERTKDKYPSKNCYYLFTESGRSKYVTCHQVLKNETCGLTLTDCSEGITLIRCVKNLTYYCR